MGQHKEGHRRRTHSSGAIVFCHCCSRSWCFPVMNFFENVPALRSVLQRSFHSLYDGSELNRALQGKVQEAAYSKHWALTHAMQVAPLYSSLQLTSGKDTHCCAICYSLSSGI